MLRPEDCDPPRAGGVRYGGWPGAGGGADGGLERSMQEGTVRRVICWFSAGAASAVATKLALKKYPAAVVARIVIPSEHPDNDRFAADCSRWFDRPIVELRSSRYADTWDVWTKKRYIAGAAGAPCTTELKKLVRNAFEEPGDRQIFGYTSQEQDRLAKFIANTPEVDIECPLIEHQLTKGDCLGEINHAGIELPAMYRLGFVNNNCIGCPKGGAGYWNKIRVDFPAVFERMATLEGELGAHLIKLSTGRVSLRELDPSVGDHKAEEMSCGLWCGVAA